MKKKKLRRKKTTPTNTGCPSHSTGTNLLLPDSPAQQSPANRSCCTNKSGFAWQQPPLAPASRGNVRAPWHCSTGPRLARHSPQPRLVLAGGHSQVQMSLSLLLGLVPSLGLFLGSFANTALCRGCGVWVALATSRFPLVSLQRHSSGASFPLIQGNIPSLPWGQGGCFRGALSHPRAAEQTEVLLVLGQAGRGLEQSHRGEAVLPPPWAGTR